MKKRSRTLLFILCCVVLILLLLAFYRFTLAKNIDSSLEASAQVELILNRNGCVSCHNPEAPMPFYGNLPGAADLVKKDITVGSRFFDIRPMLTILSTGSGRIPEVDLSKLDHSILSGSMPPLKYSALHWGTSLSDKEQSIIRGWIKSQRMMIYYPNPQTSDSLVWEPVQPLVGNLLVDENKATLGFKLFHDVRLSANNTISCATCHPLTEGGVDGLQTSKGIHDQIGGINAPTVYNAVYNIEQFWDGRAQTLQAQAGGPPLDMLEMGSTWEEIIAKISSDKALSKEFSDIYLDGVTANNITDAIAEFEIKLTTPDSRFDLYLRGNNSAITPEELEGYHLFKSNKCATCHTGMLMGGQSYEYLGIAQNTYFEDRGTEINDKDKGRFNVTGKESDLHKFKTPTLRNIALTAPYMHDGTAATLEEAINHMSKYQIGTQLTPDQTSKMVAFMNSLTGKNKFMQPTDN